MCIPYSTIIANIFMEWLEQRALVTAPADCMLNIWRRYVYDILEITPKSKNQQFTDHLNTVNPTQSITWTHKKR